ncbi:MAG: hypothetical protein OEZ29_04410 [Candidatus Bathyarchaeota archaeon]|nr:hypothetical protein [Candidatus Bathyarchaeota archaeon]MDH5779819.1 hypothetical protein [Candidatus Bathyarchaeota archaeon]
MVRCWNCEHVIRIYSGKPANEKLFENEFRKCTVNGMALNVTITSLRRENVRTTRNLNIR